MIYPLTTTLNRIWTCDPCDRIKGHLLRITGKSAPDDDPLTYRAIALENSLWLYQAEPLLDALWCCRAEPKYDPVWRRYVIWCANQVQPCTKGGKNEGLGNSQGPWSTGWANHATTRATSWSPASVSILDTTRAAARAAAGGPSGPREAILISQQKAFVQLVTTE